MKEEENIFLSGGVPFIAVSSMAGGVVACVWAQMSVRAIVYAQAAHNRAALHQGSTTRRI